MQSMNLLNSSKHKKMDGCFQRIADEIINKGKQLIEKNIYTKKCPICMVEEIDEDIEMCDKCTYKQKLTNAGIPEKYWDVDLDHMIVTRHNRNVINFCKGYSPINSEGKGIYFYGPCGTGKTHMAIAIMKNLIGKYTILFTTTPSLLLNIRSTFNDDNKNATEQKEINKYASCKFLVIDDLGVEKRSEFSRQIIGQIIHERDSHNRPMIITSNMSMQQVATDIDKRMASRLSGICYIWRLDGKDFRMNKVSIMN